MKLRNIFTSTMICIIATSGILLFYGYKLLLFYLLGLILIIIIIKKWNIVNISKINNLLKNITIIIISILIITILGEIWCHVYPHRFTGIDRLDTVGEFSDYTSRGYLTEDIFKKRPDVVRILGLGDSFSVYLTDKRKNYHNFLQQKFIDAGKSDVEIVNAGMAGVGPGYYWNILSKYGDLFKPDIVLVGFFVGNDFLENDFFIVVGDFITEPKDLIRRYSQYYQFSHLRLYKLLRNKYLRFQELELKKRETKSNTPQPSGTFSQETFLRVERARCWVFDKKSQDKLQNHWRQSAEILLKMKEWCDQRKIKLVINILPDQYQVDPKTREGVLARYQIIPEKDLNLTQPNNLIESFCRAHNIHCLDLLGQFQEQGQNRGNCMP